MNSRLASKQVLENEAGDFIYLKPNVPHEVFGAYREGEVLWSPDSKRFAIARAT